MSNQVIIESEENTFLAANREKYTNLGVNSYYTEDRRSQVHNAIPCLNLMIQRNDAIDY